MHSSSCIAVALTTFLLFLPFTPLPDHITRGPGVGHRQQQAVWLQGPERSQECELNAGDMLYLPCGWFHEVQSFGSGEEGGHLALNYWFHPPDNLDCGGQGMHKPYRCAACQASAIK